MLAAGCGTPVAPTDAGAGHVAELPDGPPKPIHIYRPLYPREEYREGLTGNATIEFVIAPDGTVSSAHVVSATTPGFGEEARKAVLKGRWAPGRKKGKAMNALVQQTFTFSPSADTKVAEPVLNH